VRSPAALHIACAVITPHPIEGIEFVEEAVIALGSSTELATHLFRECWLVGTGSEVDLCRAFGWEVESHKFKVAMAVDLVALWSERAARLTYAGHSAGRWSRTSSRSRWRSTWWRSGTMVEFPAFSLLPEGLHTLRDDRCGRAARLGAACEQEAGVRRSAQNGQRGWFCKPQRRATRRHLRDEGRPHILDVDRGIPWCRWGWGRRRTELG
jgi:hypothetical protein